MMIDMQMIIYPSIQVKIIFKGREKNKVFKCCKQVEYGENKKKLIGFENVEVIRQIDKDSNSVRNKNLIRVRRMENKNRGYR